MKGMLRVRSLLYLLPLMVFFCQKTNDPWGFCVGNNDGFTSGLNFAIGQQCPEDFPDNNGPIAVL
jgi:hypothetical protein